MDMTVGVTIAGGSQGIVSDMFALVDAAQEAAGQISAVNSNLLTICTRSGLSTVMPFDRLLRLFVEYLLRWL
jgi:hypothetical protein